MHPNFNKSSAVAYLKRHKLAYSESTPARELIKQANYHFKVQLARWNAQFGSDDEKVKLWYVLELASGNLAF